MVASAVHDVAFTDLPAAVVAQAKRCLLDLTGVAAAGTATKLSRIIRDHAARHYAAGDAGARMLFDGRRVSPVGAALAGGMTIDSLDAHDGHVLTKGHAGAAVLPALLAFLDTISDSVPGRDLLTALVIGYEVSLRAGLTLHATETGYSSSGAWNALGCAAVGARLLHLDVIATEHALGIAEYHAPRSPMMRCIDFPTMVKDGSGWGAMTGVSAALLAADGFTGAPASLIAVERSEPDHWVDLGHRWRILELYFKPQPICRWAQPAVRAVLELRQRHAIRAGDVTAVEVRTFHHAARLATRRPTTTEQAQYSLPFAVAAALVRGAVGAAEVSPEGLRDRPVLQLSDAVVAEEHDEYTRRFPAERWADVVVVLANGARLASGPCTAPGDADAPLGDADLVAKFQELMAPVLSAGRPDRIAAAVARLSEADADGRPLLDDLLSSC